MILKRLILSNPGAIYAGRLIALDTKHSNYLKQFKIKIGDSIEVLFPEGPWIIEIVSMGRTAFTARLSSPILSGHLTSIPIFACLPITSQLEIWEDWIPPLIELGVTHIQPIVYSNSNYREILTHSKFNIWNRLITIAAEQSRSNRIPELKDIIPYEYLLKWNISQKLLIFNTKIDKPNPEVIKSPLAFTCGPEGGLTDKESIDLIYAGWQPINLGSSDLRSVIMPIALMGAIQYQINR